MKKIVSINPNNHHLLEKTESKVKQKSCQVKQKKTAVKNKRKIK